MKKKTEYTQYSLVTTLPYWLVAWVNDFLVFVAELSGREVCSSQMPYREESERAGADDEQK